MANTLDLFCTGAVCFIAWLTMMVDAMTIPARALMLRTPVPPSAMMPTVMTTMIYTHVLNRLGIGVKSPLDQGANKITVVAEWIRRCEAGVGSALKAE